MNANNIAQNIFNTIDLDHFRTNATNNNIYDLINLITIIINRPEITPEIAARIDAWRGLLEITLDERRRILYNYSKYRISPASPAAGGRRKKF
jgi:hypothetical protein